MAISLPASLQELVGRRIQRISTSHDRDVIIFDTYEAGANNTTRYAYTVTETVDRFFNLSSMVGYTVTSITAGEDERNGQQKMVIRTSGGKGFGCIFFSNRDPEEGLVREEDAAQFIAEANLNGECLCFITEESALLIPTIVANTTIGRGPPYELDSSGRNYTVEEGDVDYGIGAVGTIVDCEGECA